MSAIFGAVNKIGAAKSQNMVCAFADYSVKAAHRLNQNGQVVIVYKLGIPENAGRLAKQVFHRLDVLIYLVDKFPAGIQEAQAVIIGLGQELDAAGARKRVECA
jgi:hypothetical protein